MADNKNSNASKYHLPPLFSYDPAILAEIRSLERGYKDTRRDTRRGKKRAKQDFRTTRKDIRVEKKRGLQDFSTQLERGLQEIGFKRQDTKQRFERGTQDFDIQLANTIRGFDRQGQAQMQAGNAAGVLGGGYATAAARRRAENLAIARQPIDIGQQRLAEDTQTALGRLGIAGQQLRQDIGRGRRRLRQDTRHDIRLGRREYKRTKQDYNTELQRALREKKIGVVDLTQSAIFDARQRQPGAFTKYGRKS